METIFLFSQNTNIKSFEDIARRVNVQGTSIFLTTHELFDYEKEFLNSLFKESIFITYADLLSDKEMADCDVRAYNETSRGTNLAVYASEIKRIKNELIASKIRERYPNAQGYLISYNGDLGIDDHVWKHKGFRKIKADFYYSDNRRILKSIKQILKKWKLFYKLYKKLVSHNGLLKSGEMNVYEENGFKYILIGKPYRIKYRLDAPFVEDEQERLRYNNSVFYKKNKATYMVAWHEQSKCTVPDSSDYDVAWVQDGYLPYNYADFTYSFKPDNVTYYVWDTLGAKLFQAKNLPCKLLPYRKKLYLPKPVFKDKLKTILVATSGTGDWTALKNRSDDDRVVKAFVEIAKRHPEIRIIYRCHPGWVNPSNVGINSIERVREYLEKTGLTNIAVSSNIPSSKEGKAFLVTYPRTSLEEDIKNADIIFGEHSISMVDAGFKGIPFCSVNLSGRRNFSLSIEELGFPYCDSVDKIDEVIESYNDGALVNRYCNAVDAYNKMTNEELS